MLGDPLRCGPGIVDGSGVGMLGRQPVFDRHHHGVGADGVLAAGAVMGVQVADDKAAAVEKQHDRRRRLMGVIGWRPVDPDVDRAGRPVDAAVFHPQLRVESAPRQIAQPLPRRFDTVI